MAKKPEKTNHSGCLAIIGVVFLICLIGSMVSPNKSAKEAATPQVATPSAQAPTVEASETTPPDPQDSIGIAVFARSRTQTLSLLRGLGFEFEGNPSSLGDHWGVKGGVNDPTQSALGVEFWAPTEQLRPLLSLSVQLGTSKSEVKRGLRFFEEVPNILRELGLDESAIEWVRTETTSLAETVSKGRVKKEKEFLIEKWFDGTRLVVTHGEVYGPKPRIPVSIEIIVTTQGGDVKNIGDDW